MGKRRLEDGPPLTLGTIENIDRLMRAKGLSRERLAQRTGLALRTLQDWLGSKGRERATSGDPIKTRQESAELLVTVLETSIDDLFVFEAPRTSHYAPLKPSYAAMDFSTLLAGAEAIDNNLLAITRRLHSAPRHQLRFAYNALLEKGAKELPYSVPELLSLLESPDFLARISQTIPEPELVITVGHDFEYITYEVPGKAMLEVKQPLLLWDCACETPESNPSISSCPIHGDPCGELITEYFRKGLCLIHWKGLQFYWLNTSALWPPSIDAFSLLFDMEARGDFSDNFSSLLDLGSGTGFLGLALASEAPSCTRLAFSDWLLQPLIFSALNWWKNRDSNSTNNPNIFIGLDTDWMINRDCKDYYDMVVCNPPYLPLLPGFEELGVHSTVAGTDLLVHVIENAHRIGRNVIVQISHLALEEAERAAHSHRVELRLLHTKPRLVPFRVPNAWKAIPGYFSTLISLKNGLIHSPEERHKYWHYLYALVVY